MRYQIRDYFDVWGNDEDGYNVNDTCVLDTRIELPENPTDGEIIAALRGAGYLSGEATTETIRVEGEAGYSFYLTEIPREYPLCALERDEE